MAKRATKKAKLDNRRLTAGEAGRLQKREALIAELEDQHDQYAVSIANITAEAESIGRIARKADEGQSLPEGDLQLLRRLCRQDPDRPVLDPLPAGVQRVARETHALAHSILDQLVLAHTPLDADEFKAGFLSYASLNLQVLSQRTDRKAVPDGNRPTTRKGRKQSIPNARRPDRQLESGPDRQRPANRKPRNRARNKPTIPSAIKEWSRASKSRAKAVQTGTILGNPVLLDELFEFVSDRLPSDLLPKSIKNALRQFSNGQREL